MMLPETRPRPAIAVAVALAAALAAFAGGGGVARAGLAEDAARLAASIRRGGHEVVALPPMFVDHGRPRLVALPKGAARPGAAGCTTLAVLGVRTADFTLEPERPLVSPRVDRAQEEDGDPRTRSAAGVAMLTRCGADQAQLARVLVDVTASRSALEVLVIRGDKAPGDVEDALPDRAAGPLAPRGDAGGPIEPGPLAGRIARATARGKADGAARVSRASVQAGANGVGQFAVKLPEGCHRLELFAEVPTRVPRRATDLDAEAHEAETGRLLARDRADVPDARLDFCLGEAAHVEVPFVGASEAVEVAMTDAHFALPARLPGHFGARARGSLAWALHRRHAPDPIDAPIVSAVGIQGATGLGIEVEAGRCYVAALGVRKGDARLLRLVSEIDGRRAHDEVEGHADGAAVTFCSETSTRARVEVEARGAAPAWVLLIWPLGAAPP